MGALEAKPADMDEVAVMGQDQELLRTLTSESIFDSKFVSESGSMYRESASLAPPKTEDDGSPPKTVENYINNQATEAEAYEGLVDLRQSALIARLMRELALHSSHTSSFSQLLMLRQNLVARLHRALVREAERVQSNRKTKKPKTLASASSAEYRGAAAAAYVGIDTGVTLLVQLFKSAIKHDAELCSATLEHLTSTMSTLPPLGLADEKAWQTTVARARERGGSGDGTLAQLGIDGIATVMQHLLYSPESTATAQERRLAVSVLFGLALLRGSAREILDLSLRLLGSEDEAGGSVEVQSYLRNLQQFEVPLELANMNEKEAGSFSNDFSNPATGQLSGNRTEAIACDGTFVFIHDKHGLARLGTGAAGSIPGHVYASVPGWRQGEVGWLACVGDRLYYRSPAIAPAAALVLDATTLKEVGTVLPDGSGTVKTEDNVANGLIVEVEPDKNTLHRSPLVSDGRYLHIISCTPPPPEEGVAPEPASQVAAVATSTGNAAAPMHREKAPYKFTVRTFDPLNGWHLVQSRDLAGSKQEVGHMVSERSYYNADPRTAVDVSLVFPCDGVIESWTVDGRGTGPVQLQVYRKVAGNYFQLIGENEINTLAALQTETIAVAERINVRKGDFVGWRWMQDRGQIFWDRTYPTQNVKYSSNYNASMKLKVGEMMNFDRSENCTMSIRANFVPATQDFLPPLHLLPEALELGAFYSNGHTLGLVVPPNKNLHDGTESVYAVYQWRHRDGGLRGVHNSNKFPQTTTCCFDHVNNIVWNYASLSRTVRRWRCNGFAPHHVFPSASTSSLNFPDSAAAARQLPQFTLPAGAPVTTRQAALIALCEVDRLATLTGPIVSSIADADTSANASTMFPYCVELHPATFVSLLQLLECGATGLGKGESPVAPGTTAAERSYMLMCALRTLKVNLSFLNRSGYDLAQFDGPIPARAEPLRLVAGKPKAAAAPAGVAAWSVGKVGEWLGTLGLGEHTAAFAAQGVDGAALMQMTIGDLRDVVGGKIGPARRIASAVVELRVASRDHAKTTSTTAATSTADASQTVFRRLRELLLQLIGTGPTVVVEEACGVLTLGLPAFFPNYEDRVSLLHDTLKQYQATPDAKRAQSPLISAVLNYFANSESLRGLLFGSDMGVVPAGANKSAASLPANVVAVQETLLDICAHEAVAAVDRAAAKGALGAPTPRGGGAFTFTFPPAEAAAAAPAAGAADDNHEAPATVSTCLRMLFTLQQHLVSLATTASDASPLFAAVAKFTQQVVGKSRSVLERATTAHMASTQGMTPPPPLSKALDAAIRGSFVHHLLPTMMVGLSLMTHSVALARSPLLDELQRLLAQLDAMNATVKATEITEPAEKVLKGKRTYFNKTITEECAHPYPVNTREDKMVCIPGATELTLVFHPSCRTEGGADYLDIYQNPNHNDHLFRYSGSYGGGRSAFPKEPVTVHGDTVYLYFQSERYDYSHWGWQVSVSGRLPEVAKALPWSLDLHKTTAALAGALACCLVTGPKQTDEEKEQVRWLNSLLLSGGVEDGSPAEGFADQDYTAADVDSFLNDLSNPESAAASAKGIHLFISEAERNSTGVSLGAKVRGKPVEFQTERTVLAALLKHHGIAAQAMLYSRTLLAASTGASPRGAANLPKTVLAAWRVAHKIKKWIMETEDEMQALADMEKEGRVRASPKHKGPAFPARGPNDLANEVLAKARFLLQCRPAFLSLLPPANVIEGGEGGNTTILPRFDAIPPPATLSTQISDEVLAFLKAPVEIEILKMGIGVREQRGTLRAKGFQVLRACIAASTVPSVHYDLIRPLAAALGTRSMLPSAASITEGTAAGMLEKTGPHYLDGLSSAPISVINSVRCAFMDLFGDLSALCVKARDATMRAVIIAAWNMEFRNEDVEFLLKSGMVANMWQSLFVQPEPEKAPEADKKPETPAVPAAGAAATPSQTGGAAAKKDKEKETSTELVSAVSVRRAGSLLYRLLAIQAVAPHVPRKTDPLPANASAANASAANALPASQRVVSAEDNELPPTAEGVSDLTHRIILDGIFDRLDKALAAAEAPKPDEAAGVAPAAPAGTPAGTPATPAANASTSAAATASAEVAKANANTMHDVYRTVFAMSHSPRMHTYMSEQPRRLALLLTAICSGTHTVRQQQLFIRILRRLLPSLRPNAVADVQLPARFTGVVDQFRDDDGRVNNILVFLFGMIGATVDRMLFPGQEKAGAASSSSSGGKGDSDEDSKNLMLEIVTVLRALLGSPEWHALLVDELHRALVRVSSLVTMPPQQRNAHIWAGIAALYIIGGISDRLREGGRVSFLPESGTVRSTAVVVRVSAGDIGIIPDGGKFRAMTERSTSLDRANAIDDIAADPREFPLTSEMTQLFTIFVRDEEASDPAKKPAERSILYYTFKSATLKALEVMLRHQPSINAFLASGLAPSLLSSAILPTNLFKCISLSAVEDRAVFLQRFLMPSAKGVGVTLGLADAGAKPKKKDEETLIEEFLTKTGMSRSTYKDLRQTFISMDMDGDGRITREDFQNYLTPLFGYQVEGRELDEQFGQVDARHTGAVTLLEWLHNSSGAPREDGESGSEDDGGGRRDDGGGYGGGDYNGEGGEGWWGGSQPPPRKKRAGNNRKKQAKLALKIDRPLSIVGNVEGISEVFDVATDAWTDIVADIALAEPRDLSGPLTNEAEIAGKVVVAVDPNPEDRYRHVVTLAKAGAVAVVFIRPDNELPSFPLVTGMPEPKPAEPVPVRDESSSSIELEQAVNESLKEAEEKPKLVPLFVIRLVDAERVAHAMSNEQDASSKGKEAEGEAKPAPATAQSFVTAMADDAKAELTRHGFADADVATLLAECGGSVTSAAAALYMKPFWAKAEKEGGAPAAKSPEKAPAAEKPAEKVAEKAAERAEAAPEKKPEEAEKPKEPATPEAPAASTPATAAAGAAEEDDKDDDKEDKEEKEAGWQKANRGGRKKRGWQKKQERKSDNKNSKAAKAEEKAAKADKDRKDIEAATEKKEKKKDEPAAPPAPPPAPGPFGSLFDEMPTASATSGSSASAFVGATDGFRNTGDDDGVDSGVFYDLDAISKKAEPSSQRPEVWPALDVTGDVTSAVTSMQATLATAFARSALATLYAQAPIDRPLEDLTGPDQSAFVKFLTLSAARLANDGTAATLDDPSTVMGVLRPRVLATLCRGGSATRQGLARLIAREAVGHLFRATQFHKGKDGRYLIEKSRHPSSSIDNMGPKKVQIPGAAALFVTFDPRSCTKFESNVLSFHTAESCDASSQVVACGGPAHRFHSFVVAGDAFWYKYNFIQDVPNAAEAWGYKFYVSPVPVVSNDAALMAAPSVETGLWMMEVLLDAIAKAPAPVAAELASEIFNVPVTDLILQTCEITVSRQKNRTLRLLAGMLERIELYPSYSVPDLNKLRALFSDMMTRYASAGKPLIFPQYVQDLAELMLVAQRAAAVRAGVVDPTVPPAAAPAAPVTPEDAAAKEAAEKEAAAKAEKEAAEKAATLAAMAAMGEDDIGFDLFGDGPSPTKPAATTPAAAATATTPAADAWFRELVSFKDMLRDAEERAPLPVGRLERALKEYKAMRAEAVPLKLAVHSCDANPRTPEQSANMNVVVEDDANVFSMDRMTNIHLVIKGKTKAGETEPPLISFSELRLRTAGSNFASVQDMLVFVSMEPLDTAALSKWDEAREFKYPEGITEADVAAQAAKAAAIAKGEAPKDAPAEGEAGAAPKPQWKDTDPVLYISAPYDEYDSGWFKLSSGPRQGRYVTLKLLRSNKTYMNQLDLKYVGLKGTVIETTSEAAHDPSPAPDAPWNTAPARGSTRVGGLFTAELDAQMVRHINVVSDRMNVPPLQLTLADVLSVTPDRGHCPGLVDLPGSVLASRFLVLRSLNAAYEALMPLVDMALVEVPWALAGQVARNRQFMFFKSKLVLWQRILDVSLLYTEGDARIKVDRLAAKAAEGEDRAAMSTFAQALKQLNPLEPRMLRTKSQAFFVKFLGEGANDSGGPYRELVSDFCAELMDPDTLPLFTHVPNHAQSVGLNREKLIPRASAANVSAITSFQFLGKLMGIGIRTQFALDLMLPSIVWKQLVKSPLTRDDLEGVDQMTVQSMNELRNIHNTGVTEDTFGDVIMQEFTTQLSDGTNVELMPGGSDVPVTFHNRHEFADLVEKVHLAETRTQCEAIMAGLGTIVPVEMLAVFTWEEIELMVCGRAEVDLTLLRANTEYAKDVDENATHIKYFWDVLEGYTHEERRLFLRFVWGRSRLPVAATGWEDKFKIQAATGDTNERPDDYLPVSHTCFFSMQLPKYSSIDVLRAKLTYSIVHCQAIDTDFAPTAAPQPTRRRNDSSDDER